MLKHKKAFVLISVFLLLVFGLLYHSFWSAWLYNTQRSANDVTIPPLHDDVTVISAFFDIGTFGKGSPNALRSAKTYRQWILSFSLVENPMIIYVDNDEDVRFMKSIRSVFPVNMTQVIKVTPSTLWSFQLEPRIARIYSQHGYPKHHPNTVNPKYSMVMHAKYELLKRTITNNPFWTKYFCWLDVGLFRDLGDKGNISNPSASIGPKFHIYLPPDFQNDSVSYCEVNTRIKSVTVEQIVRGNLVWVCGCFFIGELNVLHRWAEEYMSAVEKMLRMNIMSTDQQVIYALANTMHPVTKIHTYKGDGRYDAWFHLGYVLRGLGLKQG